MPILAHDLLVHHKFLWFGYRAVSGEHHLRSHRVVALEIDVGYLVRVDCVAWALFEVCFGLRPDNDSFYFRRSLRAFSALSTPLFEPPPVPLLFFSPDTLSLAAFVAAPLTFLPMLPM